MSLALTDGTIRSLSGPRTRLRKRHLDALQAAISDAEAWRGSLMGHYPDDAESTLAEQERLAKFDARIKVMREALALVRKMNKEK